MQVREVWISSIFQRAWSFQARLHDNGTSALFVVGPRPDDKQAEQKLNFSECTQYGHCKTRGKKSDRR